MVPLTYLYAGGDADLVNLGHVCGEQRDADIAALYRHYDKLKRGAQEVELTAAEEEVLAYLRTQRAGSALTKYQHVYGRRSRIIWAAVGRLVRSGRVEFNPTKSRWFYVTPPDVPPAPASRP